MGGDMPLPDITDLTGAGHRPGGPRRPGPAVAPSDGVRSPGEAGPQSPPATPSPSATQPPAAAATAEEAEVAYGVPEARRTLGRQLAALRKAAGYSQHGFAPLTLYGRSTLANVETGRQNVPRQFWQRCDVALDAGGTLLGGFEAVQALRHRAHLAAAEVAANRLRRTAATTVQRDGLRPAARAGTARA